MRALDRKLWRELWAMRGQALAIVLVMAGGVATYAMSAGTLASLRSAQARFYDDYNFGQVFCALKRAPEAVAESLRELPGVAAVETRVVADARLEVRGFDEPVTGSLISVPDNGRPVLNRLYLRRGRLPDATRDDEAVLGDAFAKAHGLVPGDTLWAVINGRRKRLVVVGVGLSPAQIFQMPPGAVFPDFARHGVLWMARTPLAAAYGMDGAFNDVVLTMAPRAAPGAAPGRALPDVTAGLDRVLAPYGGLGAHGRADQLSHRYLSEEFKQLGHMATLFPAIFLGVAAFLCNVVFSRVVDTQREMIAVLKAFGYSRAAVAGHYLRLVAAVALAGAGIGLGAGAWMGRGLCAMYLEFYRFPSLEYVFSPKVATVSVLVCLGAAGLGTVRSVLRASALPPAEGMRPEPPATYGRTLPERLGLGHLLSQSARMIVRNMERRPGKTLMTMVGIALACAIMMTGTSFNDAVDHLIWVQYGLAERDDLSVTFTEPSSRRALFELAALPGVERVEGYRSVPVRLRVGQRTYRTEIRGLPARGDLYRLLDADLRPVDLPPAGLVVTDYLAGLLRVRPGQEVTVEVLEGSRPVRRTPLVGVVSQYLGVSGYMDLDALNRLMGQGNAVSGASLAVDAAGLRDVHRRLQERPRVAGTVVKKDALKGYMQSMERQVLVFAFFNTLLAGAIAFGVVYNSARIALAERSRELASLRVLGYTRGEISAILLGELAGLTLAAIPLGFLLGRGLCALLYRGMQNDLFRIPLVLQPGTYALAAAVVLASAVVSALVVRRGLDRLDLVAVLKTKE